MKIGEMLSLIGAGYSAENVREIGSMAKDKPEVIELAKSVKSMDELHGLLELESDGSEQNPPTPQPAPDPAPKGQDPVDYAKLYEDEKKRTEELNKKLKEAQSANINRDNSGNVTDPWKAAEDQVAAFINEL